MSFLSVHIAVPLWLLLLMIVGLIPLLFQILRWLKSKGFLHKADIVIDARMTTIIPAKKASDSEKKPKRQNEVKILKLLASKGEQGMLLQSIADALGIDSLATKNALEYLEGKKLLAVIKGMSGDTFSLTPAGKNYCEMKGYNSSA